MSERGKRDMRTNVTERIRKKAEENGVKIYGRLRLEDKSDTLITFEDDKGHRFVWSPLAERLTIIILCE